MPLQATSGAASYDAFGGGVPVVPNYIEEVFSTWLYTGNSSTQTITNNIDLSTKGGLVWVKRRDSAGNNSLYDTARGVEKRIGANLTTAEDARAGVTAFNSTGFSLGADDNAYPALMASWTFRKQPKFFDVVTYTGSGSTQTINHNLGSAPGCIIIKIRSQPGSNWWVWHRGDGTTFRVLNLDNTEPSYTSSYSDGNSVLSAAPTSTSFSVKTTSVDAYGTNETGESYVAYVFAHNAGGFGLTGTDNVISCGSYVGNQPSTVTVTLGYEPQWLLIKNATNTSDWYLFDNMRGLPVTGSQAVLNPNNSDAESQNAFTGIRLTATGFQLTLDDTTLNASGQTYIYIAIRRGPMKVPTSGTSVFEPVAYAGDDAAEKTVSSAVNAPDFSLTQKRNQATWLNHVYDRLRGNNRRLITDRTNAESGANGVFLQNGITLAATDDNNKSGINYINYFFRRAPSFFDEVCYTGTGSATTQAHNIGVAPQ
jgi:hypothetical protein